MDGNEFKRVAAEIATVSRARAEAIKELADAVNAGVSPFTSRDRLYSKLMKLGIALVAFPDPLTDVAGSTLIAAALIRSKVLKRELKVREVPLAFMNTYRELARIREELLK
jgi:hypothetical protein